MHRKAFRGCSTSCHTFKVEAPRAGEMTQGPPLQVTWVWFPALITPVPGGLALLSDLQEHPAHTWCTYIHIIKVNMLTLKLQN